MHRFSLLGALAALFFAFGCARFPADRARPDATRVAFDVSVAGQLRPEYLYYVVIETIPEGVDPANPPGPGPIPVVAPPWGNGFAAGTFDYYVVLSGNADPLLFQAAPTPEGETPAVFVPRGLPAVVVPRQPGAARYQFTLTLDQLTRRDGRPVRALRLNLLHTNVRPVDPFAPVNKLWDALGDGTQPGQVNRPRTIVLDQSATYPRVGDDPEPAGDVRLGPGGVVNEPDLDIVAWRIDVVRP